MPYFIFQKPKGTTNTYGCVPSAATSKPGTGRSYTVSQSSIGNSTETMFRYTVIQREVLDVIGNALKHRQIDFLTATELGDQLRAGREDKVVLTLNKITGASIKVSDLLTYNDAN